MKLDKELVDKSEASLQEKIRADGKPHFDELETLQARHSSVSVMLSCFSPLSLHCYSNFCAS